MLSAHTRMLPESEALRLPTPVVRFREELRRAEARYFAHAAVKRWRAATTDAERARAQIEALEWSKELR